MITHLRCPNCSFEFEWGKALHSQVFSEVSPEDSGDPGEVQRNADALESDEDQDLGSPRDNFWRVYRGHSLQTSHQPQGGALHILRERNPRQYTPDVYCVQAVLRPCKTYHLQMKILQI